MILVRKRSVQMPNVNPQKTSIQHLFRFFSRLYICHTYIVSVSPKGLSKTSKEKIVNALNAD
jgi:hypothetical protein